MKRTELWDQLDDYWQVLQSSLLTDTSVEDYYYFAECFVRWTAGQFVPGERLSVLEEEPRRATARRGAK